MENIFRLADNRDFFNRRCVLINGPIIVGAGPSGLATAACLKEQGVPFVVLERADCIASLWQKRTYDRLKLHLPKQFCQLPKMPFPEDFPEYPTKKQFIQYLESYATRFDIKPQFNECVQSARYDETSGFWRVKTVSSNSASGVKPDAEYICRWLIVATGENAESVIPDIEGLGDFSGDIVHASEYKSGEKYRGKKVLVVGCGNSGMELSLDLCNHNASPSMVIRSSVSIKNIFFKHFGNENSSFIFSESNRFFALFLNTGSRFAPRSIRKVDIRIGGLDDGMVAAMASGQDHAISVMVGSRKHREVRAEKTRHGTFRAEEQDGKNPCFGHWSVGQDQIRRN